MVDGIGRMAGGDLLWVWGRRAGASLGDEGGGWGEGMGCGWGGTEVKCDRVGWEFSCGRAESFMARRWKRGL
jgi:hypothetical protein